LSNISIVEESIIDLHLSDKVTRQLSCLTSFTYAAVISKYRDFQFNILHFFLILV